MGYTAHPETLRYFLAGRGRVFSRSDWGYDGHSSQYSTPDLPKGFTGILGGYDSFSGQNDQFSKPVCKTCQKDRVALQAENDKTPRFPLRFRWWAMTGSNRRHSRCKRDALPTELIAHFQGRRLFILSGDICKIKCHEK